MDKLIFEPLIRIENKSGEAFYSEDAGTVRANASRNYQMVIANTVTASAYLQRGERELINGRPSKEPTPEWKRRIRRLTPVECERLQGFPDGWTEYGIDEDGKQVLISDTQRYKCLGNAVSTNVIARIISGWKELQEKP